MSDAPRGKHVGTVAPKSDTPTYGHLMQCPECGVWFDCRDLGAVLAHDGQMPHPTKDRPQ
jgi:hypothetical protein